MEENRENRTDISPVGNLNQPNGLLKRSPKIRFRLKQNGHWLTENNCGQQGVCIQAVAIDFKGHGWYQVCTAKDGWLEPVRGYDIKDPKNGYGGKKDSPIVGIRAVNEGGYFSARYRVSELKDDWMPYQYNSEDDSFAGDYGPLDRFQIDLVPLK